MSATIDLSSLLIGIEPDTQPAAALTILRDVSLPANAMLSVTIDGEPESAHVPLFSPGDARGGFGAVFGEGGFGYDASTGPGLGQGALGFGPLGSDGVALHWRDESLSQGSHTIDLLLEDQAGQPATPIQTLDLTIDRLPQPPVDVSLNEAFKLTWT